jgi:hypothetical protein
VVFGEESREDFADGLVFREFVEEVGVGASC